MAMVLVVLAYLIVKVVVYVFVVMLVAGGSETYKEPLPLATGHHGTGRHALHSHPHALMSPILLSIPDFFLKIPDMDVLPSCLLALVPFCVATKKLFEASLELS